MNAEVFAEWFRRQGHRVYRTASSYWYDAGPQVLQAFPYHWQITPSEEELRSLMLKRGIVGLRYSAPFDFGHGKVSYHVVAQKPYCLEELKSQSRNGVRKGMGHFVVEPISFERLATEGWRLQEDTLARQDRLRCMERCDWECLCRSAKGLADFEAWGAMENGNLAGAAIVCRIDDVYSIPYALSHRCFLGEHVNNVLFYRVTCELLARDGVREVFFTVQSLDAPASVDEFKFRMGLKPRLVRQCVEFHPWLRPAIGPALYRAVAGMQNRDPGSPVWAKAEGMLRFHLMGRLPPAEQEWHECICDFKKSVLAGG